MVVEGRGGGPYYGLRALLLHHALGGILLPSISLLTWYDLVMAAQSTRSYGLLR